MLSTEVTLPRVISAQTSMPSMPSISAPSITSPSAPILQTSENTTKTETAETRTNTLSNNVTAASLLNLTSLDTDGSLSSLLQDDSDSSSLNDLLSLSNIISGNTDINSLLSSTTQSSTNTQASSTALLNTILEKLSVLTEQIEQLKKETPVSSERSALSIPETNLLRFSVNGYNVLATCTAIFFSTPDEDGSFLCTGDREYMANGIKRKETFYMLFSTSGNNTFDVAVNVMQDYLNEYSFLYQLSKREHISAVKNSNMVSIIIDDPLWKLNFLCSF